MTDKRVEVWQLREGRYSLLGAFATSETFESAFVGAVEAARLFEG